MSELIPELEEFLQVVDEINGLYHDTTAAYCHWRDRVVECQKQINKKTGISLADLDRKPFAYGTFETDEAFAQDHIRTQYDIKERNKENGVNYMHIANTCIVMLHQYWEYYRGDIEKKHNLGRNIIQSNLMADIRYIRNSILKHRGLGNHEMKKCKVLTWFKEGDRININKEQFKSIVEKIRKEITAINNNYLELK